MVWGTAVSGVVGLELAAQALRRVGLIASCSVGGESTPTQ
jgi:hypothetical protein